MLHVHVLERGGVEDMESGPCTQHGIMSCGVLVDSIQNVDGRVFGRPSYITVYVSQSCLFS